MKEQKSWLVSGNVFLAAAMIGGDTTGATVAAVFGGFYMLIWLMSVVWAQVTFARSSDAGGEG